MAVDHKKARFVRTHCILHTRSSSFCATKVINSEPNRPRTGPRVMNVHKGAALNWLREVGRWAGGQGGSQAGRQQAKPASQPASQPASKQASTQASKLSAKSTPQNREKQSFGHGKKKNRQLSEFLMVLATNRHSLMLLW